MVTDDGGLVEVTDVLREHLYFFLFWCRRGLCAVIYVVISKSVVQCYTFLLLPYSFTLTLFRCSVSVHLSHCIKVASILSDISHCFGDYFKYYFPPSFSVVSFFLLFWLKFIPGTCKHHTQTLKCSTDSLMCSICRLSSQQMPARNRTRQSWYRFQPLMTHPKAWKVPKCTEVYYRSQCRCLNSQKSHHHHPHLFLLLLH